MANTYLGYFEVLEGSAFKVSDNLQELKDEWCFTRRIYLVPDKTQAEFGPEFSTWEKPRFDRVKTTFELIHKEGDLMHETE